MKRRLIANSASGLVERFLNLVVQVWLFQYLIKRISPEEYSLYPIVNALLIFVPPLLTVLVAGLARDTVEADARQDDRRVTEITSTMFPVLSAAAFGLLLVSLVLTKNLTSILRIAPENLSEARWMVMLLFGGLALRVFLTPFGVGLYVRQKFVLSNTLNVIQAVIRVMLLFALLLGLGPRVLWVVVATVSADVSILLVTTILSVQALPALKFRFDRIRWGLLSGLMSFGFWNMISSLGVMIRQSSDLLILNRFASPIDVDTFQLASLTDSQIDAALNKMNEPAIPLMVSLHTASGVTALQKFVNRGGRYCMWAALFVATPLLAFGHELWSLYLGSKLHVFAEVPLVMTLLLARYWIEGPFYVIGAAGYVLRRMRTLSTFIIASSLSNVAITIYFVHFRHMGAIGSALGTLVCVAIWTPMFIGRFCLNLVKLDVGAWIKNSFLKGAMPGAVALMFGLGWRHWVQPETISQMVLATGMVSLVYVLVILRFCLDEEEERQLKRVFANFSFAKTYKALASLVQF
jgi:O-antigen/teichoic acid export membrane protein